MLIVGGSAILFGSMITNPANREITNRISKTIDNGQTVVIWPNGIDDKGYK